MTQNILPFARAMTAIAAVLAFTSTHSVAQEAGAPPEPVADTTVETPATADPLAPELTADQAPAEAAVPAASKPKVETARNAATRSKASSSSSMRSTTRRTSALAPAPAAAAPVATEAATPAPLPAEPPPPVVEPAAPAAEPVAASDTSTMDELMADNMLPIAGAAALGLAALGGTALAMRRRRRRREDQEFAERQRLLDMAEANQAEPEPIATASSGPAFARTAAPMHDPVPTRAAPPVAASGGFAMAGNKAAERPVEPRAKIPEKGNWESRNDSDFLFRRAGKPADEPIEPAK